MKKKLQKIIDNIDYKEDLDDSPFLEIDSTLDIDDKGYYKKEEDNEDSFYPNNYKNNNHLKNNYNNIYDSKPSSNTNLNIQINMKNGNKLNNTDLFDLFDNCNICYNNNAAQTPMEEFDFEQFPLQLEKIKYTFKSFKNKIKNNCEKIILKLLNKNYLENKKLFSKIYHLIENNINIIKEKFEKSYENKSKNIYEIIAKEMKGVLRRACKKNGVDNYYKILEQEDLDNIAQNITDKYFKDRIESKIYEEIQGKIIEKYAEEFKNNLLLCFDELILENKTISNVFNKQGEENTNIIFDKIRSSISFEKDDLETVLNNRKRIENKIFQKDKIKDNSTIKKENISNNDSDEPYENNIKENESDDNSLEKENEN